MPSQTCPVRIFRRFTALYGCLEPMAVGSMMLPASPVMTMQLWMTHLLFKQRVKRTRAQHVGFNMQSFRSGHRGPSPSPVGPRCHQHPDSKSGSSL
ncbi:hypothetical protein O181_016825 [Austropuccinia psidii MF-1]|uniref:Uncharacterized protein n=1 Tax=Austropuccinia psidii MF-1 TaxID=1389203 RepID=A0A9Q3C5N8_9BASI|nr:hypothetical protein [Austropuccinia psidii MF-1]